MPHRRTSGAKVRSHKLGVSNVRFQAHKLARLEIRRLLAMYVRSPESVAV